MKYYIAIAVAIILVIGGYFIFKGPGASDLTRTNAEPVVVSMIKKTVYVQASTTKAEVVEPVQAFEGEKVETLDSGRALVQMQNGTLTTVDYSTSLTIKTHSDDEHSSMVLGGGKVWSTVKKVFGQGEYYEIETQNAVAVVRGTSFGFSYSNEVTTLEVTEGSVTLVPIDSETGERLNDKARLVSAGQKAVVLNDGIITVSDLTPNDESSEWFIFNNGWATDSQSDTGSQTDVRILELQIKPR